MPYGKNDFLLFMLLLLTSLTRAAETKPVALFHAGPGKTGTTHLQALLVQHEATLLEHNFAVWPNLYDAFRLCKSDGRLHSSDGMMATREKTLAFYYLYYERCPPMQNRVRVFIQDSARLNQNVIFSSETFLSFSPAVKNLLDMLNAENFQIHGVVGYRFPLNWFISRYGEEIKTFSITSRESRPSQQISAPLLSDYLGSHWKKQVVSNHLKIFYKGLSMYPSHVLSIIDLYGTIAAKKEIYFVFLCEVAGVMCNSTQKDMKDLQTHESESQSMVYKRQMAFLFAEYAARHDCKMDFAQKKSKARELMRSIVTNQEGKEASIPLRSVNLTRYALLSLDMDRKFRAAYGKHFVNGNAEANAMKVRPPPSIQEVDRAAVFGRRRWRRVMVGHLKAAQRRGLCQSSRQKKDNATKVYGSK